jgi:uncharacterized coiled-coil protein SlyX
VSSDQAPGNLEVRPRKDSSASKSPTLLDQTGKPTWVPPPSAHARTEPSLKDSDAVRSPEDAQVGVGDDGYSRFYSTFGNIINRLSAPLAFAGLPLIAEETPLERPESREAAPTKRNRSRSTHSSSGEPDISKLYSRATLRAISRDGHGPNDSFYVVPTSGHTVSYANILSFAEKEKRRMEASLHGDALGTLEDDEDDFVDARETPVPLSPSARRRVGKARTEKELNNTIEELHLENKSLKDMLDKLSKRLHAFEACAQNSSLALAESMRLIRPGSPLSSGGTPLPGKGAPSSLVEEALRKRNQELEEQLAASMQRMEGLEQELYKMQRTLAKYREKWEKLKAGAKARRDAQVGATEHVDEDAAGPS